MPNITDRQKAYTHLPLWQPINQPELPLELRVYPLTAIGQIAPMLRLREPGRFYQLLEGEPAGCHQAG